jgi:ubiquinone/menaquinone biosynthesis C-methylase UbiE
MSQVNEIRQRAIKRHDIDSSMFQGRYHDYKLGKYTDAFIYGRYQISDEIEKELAKLPANAKILDLGCGTGHYTRHMKDRGFDAVGMEPSEKMIGFAKENFPDIEFKPGVASDMPYADNTFDFIISIEVLRYLHPDDVEASYKEIYRVLKPKGRIFITHVNLYATDAYIFFYHIQQFFRKMMGEHLHSCYFTTAGTEERIAKKVGFVKTESVGRSFASVRIGFKFGRFIGGLWAKFLELFNKEQRFENNPSKSMAGHLIFFAEKG